MHWLDFRLHQRLDLSSSTLHLEEIYAMLAEIDGVKNSWHLTGKLLPQTIERLTRTVIVTSSGASNRIEGNQLTDIEVESLGFPERTVEAIIKKLVDLKRLEKVGQGRATRYKLVR